MLFHTVHINHVAPFIRSRNKNTQILVIVDDFTKSCILEPVRDTAVKGNLRAFGQLIAIFEVPSRTISDRGTAFTLHSFKTFCEEHDMEQVLNAVATPRANGQCERMNRTVFSSLAATCADMTEELWDESVKKVQSAINCTINPTAPRSPTQLLFGYKRRSMTDAMLLSEIQGTLLQISLQAARRAAKAGTYVEQLEQKR